MSKRERDQGKGGSLKRAWGDTHHSSPGPARLSKGKRPGEEMGVEKSTRYTLAVTPVDFSSAATSLSLR